MNGATSAPEPVVWPGEKERSWSGCPRALLIEVLQDGVRRFPDNTVLIFDDGFSITASELWSEVGRFAGFLRGRVAVGERIALAIGNRAEFVIAYLAIVANRGVAVMLSPEIGPHEADYVISDAAIKLAIVDATASSVFNPIRESDGHLSCVLAVEGAEPTGFHHLCADQQPVDLSAVQAELTDLVDIGYTSGTTGLPKALGGNHLEVLRYVDVQLRFHHQGSGRDRKLIPLQLHYGDPLVALFTAIYSGSAVILMRKFSASRFWKTARDLDATYIVTIGSIPDMLLSRPEGPGDRNHSIRCATALAIPRDRHAELERRFGFPWREAYGSSESGPALAMPEKFGDEFVGSGAIGIPYPDVAARLVDQAGQVLQGPAAGELELSGMVVFDGYLNNADATKEVLHDGWLRTGDIMQRDERGVYYFEGRRKELIRRSGVNIAPAEIEAVLRLHSGVVDCAVVPVEDPVMGEEIKAYVELADGATFDPADLVAFCAARLARQKVPRYLERRDSPFPRTETQRIPKGELMVDGAHQTGTAWDRLAEEVR